MPKNALLSPPKDLQRINTYPGWFHEEHDCIFPAEHVICLAEPSLGVNKGYHVSVDL